MSGAGRVLVIDDDPLIGKVATEILGRRGFEVSTLLRADSAQETVLDRRPDLILLDFDLTTSLGTEVAMLLKADPRTASIPIIFSSGMTDADHQEICRVSGGAAFLEKPYGETQLLDMVRSVLGRI